jgi:hypothetical protein
LASTSFPGSLQIILWTHNKISYAEGFLLVEFFKEFGCLVNKTYENASGCIWVITPSKLLLNCPIPFIPILCREK